MTIKQKADAYDAAIKEAAYWRRLTTVGDRLAQGRAGAPGLFALASQEYDHIKSQDVDGFAAERQREKEDLISLLGEIESRITSIKERLNENY